METTYWVYQIDFNEMVHSIKENKYSRSTHLCYAVVNSALGFDVFDDFRDVLEFELDHILKRFYKTPKVNNTRALLELFLMHMTRSSIGYVHEASTVNSYVYKVFLDVPVLDLGLTDVERLSRFV